MILLPGWPRSRITGLDRAPETRLSRVKKRETSVSKQKFLNVFLTDLLLFPDAILVRIILLYQIFLRIVIVTIAIIYYLLLSRQIK